MSVPQLSTGPLVPPPLPVLGAMESRWSPPADGSVTTHTGAPLPPDLLYIAAPPTDDIGAVVSAYSTIRGGKGGEKRILRRIGGMLMGAFLACIVIVGMGTSWLGIPFSIPLVVIALLVGGIPGFLTSAPENTTTYVCETGAVKYVWGGKDKPVKSEAWFRYGEATDLLTSQTRHYTNGIYTGTEWSAIWGRLDPDTTKYQKLFTLAGRFYRTKGPSDDDETFHFSTALEAAYSRFHLAQALATLDAGGSVPFRVGWNGVLTLAGQGVLTISAAGLHVDLGGKQEFVGKGDIHSVGINAGVVTIVRAGFKKGFLGVGNQGVYSFDYGALSNARLFLVLLATVIGQDEPREGDAPPEPDGVK